MQIDAITRKSSLPAILLLVVVAVAALVRMTCAPYDMEIAESPFRERTISVICAFLLLLATSLAVGRLFMSTGLSKSFCTLPIPIFGILAWGVAVPPQILSSMVAAFVFAMTLLLLCRSINRTDERNSVFVGGVLLGTMPLFDPIFVILVVAIPLVALLFTLNMRQIFIAVVGYLLPLFLASYVVWYGGGDIDDVAANITARLTMPREFAITHIPFGAIVLSVWVVAMGVWGIVYAILKPNKMFLVARLRRTLYLFVLLAVVMAAMLFVPNCGLSLLPVAAVVGAVLISFVLSLLPTRDSTIAYWILLALFVAHLFIE